MRKGGKHYVCNGKLLGRSSFIILVQPQTAQTISYLTILPSYVAGYAAEILLRSAILQFHMQ